MIFQNKEKWDRERKKSFAQKSGHLQVTWVLMKLCNDTLQWPSLHPQLMPYNEIKKNDLSILFFYVDVACYFFKI